MTEFEQLRRVCQWNHDLARENARLRLGLCRKNQACRELERANADLRVERDASDALLGSAMDEVLSRSTP
jgi:hypothetical protein